MSLSRLRRGEWMAGLGAIALVVVTFRAWYGLDGTNLTAWDLLKYGRYLLLGTAVGGLALVLAVATGRSEQTSFMVAVRAAVVGFACAIYLVYRLVERPDGLDPVAGPFVGLASSLLVTAGGMLAMRPRSQA